MERLKASPRLLPDSSFLRFLLVGGSNFVVSYSVFVGLLMIPYSSQLKTSFAQLLSYGVGTLWSLYWNRTLAFRSRGAFVPQAMRFLFLQGSLALTSAALIGTAVEVLGFGARSSWFLVMSGITILNYLIMKWWVFR